MKIKRLLSLFIITLMVFCTACSYKYEDQFEKSGSDLGSRDDKSGLSRENKLYGFQSNHLADHHQMNTMKFSQETANALSSMNGIHMSYVILTDRNAYVAIALDNSATGTSGRGNVTQLNNIGKSQGVYDREFDIQYEDPNPAYSIEDPKHISSKLKQKIAKKVRSINPDVSEVFITANRDFLNIVNSYYINYLRGSDLDSYLPEFKNMVSKHFVE